MRAPTSGNQIERLNESLSYWNSLASLVRKSFAESPLTENPLAESTLAENRLRLFANLKGLKIVKSACKALTIFHMLSQYSYSVY